MGVLHCVVRCCVVLCVVWSYALLCVVVCCALPCDVVFSMHFRYVLSGFASCGACCYAVLFAYYRLFISVLVLCVIRWCGSLLLHIANCIVLSV